MGDGETVMAGSGNWLSGLIFRTVPLTVAFFRVSHALHYLNVFMTMGWSWLGR